LDRQHVLNILITIDTEAYPLTADWRQRGVQADIDRDIYARTSDGEFGLDYQIDTFRKCGLTAVFMVESLFASVPSIGTAPLREIVAKILGSGNDVQLHLHPEWIPHIPQLASRWRGGYIRFYSEDDQYRLLKVGSENLIAAGAPGPKAFRAGDFAADLNTLRALHRAGLQFDSSYNAAYLSSTCRISTDTPVRQPQVIENVCEFPVTTFEDYPGHLRHAQLCACSYQELTSMLAAAERAGWTHFVIVSHAFEMLRNRRRTDRPLSVRRVVVSRFQKLCRFLAENSNRYRTVTFADLNAADFDGQRQGAPLKSNRLRTAFRMCEQALDRL
jgi:hypothetical protein